MSSTITTHASTTDPRLLNLSYSGLTTFHTCPRKFQLSKLRSVAGDESTNSLITFSYGHVVGLGIQNVLEGKSEDQNMWEMFQAWTVDLWSDNPKQKKSFSGAIYAVQKFQALLDQGYLNDYELVYYEGKPACELSFLIHLPNGYKYRGFVDAVLRNKYSGEVIVLECKTSSGTTVNPTTYKNSAQAIGYSIVLDAIFPELSSYRVIYLVYSTKTLNYESLDFAKSYVQRARWIRELILDVEVLALYESNDLYPMHGESCISYGYDCTYMNLCQMSTERLVPTLDKEAYETMVTDIETKNSEFQIKLTIEDLIQTQLTKVGEGNETNT